MRATPLCGGTRTSFISAPYRPFGLRRDDLIVKDGDMFAVEERMAEYESWRRDRVEAIDNAQRPSVRVQTATAWAAAAAALGIDDEIAATSAIEIIELPGAAGRPRGPRFGTLVHAVLATVALDASAEDIVSTAETQGRMLLSTPEEIRAAVSGRDRRARPRSDGARTPCRRCYARNAGDVAAEGWNDD